MSEKLSTWTRTRVGRNRVHWVAYARRSDDDSESEARQIVDQGYATSLVEADQAARAALAAAGMHQARRLSKGFGRASTAPKDKTTRPTTKPQPTLRREYLYTRNESDDGVQVAAHLIVKKTAKRVYVTKNSCGPDQVGTGDEPWVENERTIALDRLQLEQDGSVFSKNYRHSNFYSSREAAEGEGSPRDHDAFAILRIQAPCPVEDIKAAYRRRAFEVHPDRGGSPSDFQAVEAAYRQLLREAQTPEG